MFFRHHNKQIRENHRLPGKIATRTLLLERLDERRMLSVSQLVPTDSVPSRSVPNGVNESQYVNIYSVSPSLASSPVTPKNVLSVKVHYESVPQGTKLIFTIQSPPSNRAGESSNTNTDKNLYNNIDPNSSGDTGKDVKDGGAGENKKGGEVLEDGDYGLSAGTNKRIREILHNLAVNLRDGDQAAVAANLKELEGILKQAKIDRETANKAAADKAAADKAK